MSTYMDTAYPALIGTGTALLTVGALVLFWNRFFSKREIKLQKLAGPACLAGIAIFAAGVIPRVFEAAGPARPTIKHFEENAFRFDAPVSLSIHLSDLTIEKRIEAVESLLLALDRGTDVRIRSSDRGMLTVQVDFPYGDYCKLDYYMTFSPLTGTDGYLRDASFVNWVGYANSGSTTTELARTKALQVLTRAIQRLVEAETNLNGRIVLVAPLDSTISP